MFTKEELELQYSPRKWAKRAGPDEVIPLHIEICEKVSKAAKKNVPCQLDVPYGDLQREKNDIYGIDLPPGKLNAQCNIRQTTLFNGGSVMVWGGICLTARTDLVPLRGGTLNSQRYINEILSEHVVPFAPYIGYLMPLCAPILIYIHGGYWQSLSKETSGFAVEPLYKHGVKVIVMGYSLCPQVSFSDVVKGTQKAFQQCLKYAKTNGSRGLYIIGHSAGSHLAASIVQQAFYPLTEDDKKIIKGAFLFNGIFDLLPLLHTTVNNNLKLCEEEAKRFSPCFHNFDAASDMIFVFLVGEYESSAYHEQSSIMHNKLKSDGYRSELIIVEKVDHFNIVENLCQADYKIVEKILDVIECTK